MWAHLIDLRAQFAACLMGTNTDGDPPPQGCSSCIFFNTVRKSFFRLAHCAFTHVATGSSCADPHRITRPSVANTTRSYLRAPLYTVNTNVRGRGCSACGARGCSCSGGCGARRRWPTRRLRSSFGCSARNRPSLCANRSAASSRSNRACFRTTS